MRRERIAIGAGLACLLLLGCGSRSGDSQLDRAALVLEPGVSSAVLPTAAPPTGAPPTAAPPTVAAPTGALPTTGDSLEGNATPQVEATAADSENSPSSVLATPPAASAEPQAQAQVQTLELVGGEVANDDACRVWLDTADSPLTQQDISVRVDGNSWPSTSECSNQIAWQLILDDSGVWLGVCPAGCEQLAAQPAVRMIVEATYWEEVPKKVR